MKGVCFDTVIARQLPGVPGTGCSEANIAQENLHATLGCSIDDP